MTLNALGVLILLSRIIPVKFEYKPMKNILLATIVMGIFLLIVHFLLSPRIM